MLRGEGGLHARLQGVPESGEQVPIEIWLAEKRVLAVTR